MRRIQGSNRLGETQLIGIGVGRGDGHEKNQELTVGFGVPSAHTERGRESERERGISSWGRPGAMGRVGRCAQAQFGSRLLSPLHGSPASSTIRPSHPLQRRVLGDDDVVSATRPTTTWTSKHHSPCASCLTCIIFPSPTLQAIDLAAPTNCRRISSASSPPHRSVPFDPYRLSVSMLPSLRRARANQRHRSRHSNATPQS